MPQTQIHALSYAAPVLSPSTTSGGNVVEFLKSAALIAAVIVGFLFLLWVFRFGPIGGPF